MQAVASPRIWIAKAGSQRRYLSCPHFEALYGGTRGPGKSDCLLMDYAQHVGRGFERHWRGIIFRQTYPQLSEIIEKSIRWFSQIFPNANYNKAAHTWEFADGEQLIFRHMDDPADYWNYHGHEYPFIGWEEVTTWPDDRCYVAMMSCCRSSRAGMPRKYRANANPWGVGHHWVKERFVTPAPSGTVIYPCYGPNCGWAGPKEDVQIANGRWICPKCGTWGSLNRLRVMVSGHYAENTSLTEADPDYIVNLQSQTDEAKRKAWLEGDWNIAAGSYFGDLWSSAHHVVESFDVPATWLINRSFDWGSSRPFSVGWWAQSDGTEATMRDGTKRSWPRGTLFRIAEWYGWNGRANEGLRMLASEIARGVLEHEKAMGLSGRVKAGPADSSIFEESNGKCIADEMARSGVAWARSDKSPGSRAVGAELMRSLLAAGRESKVEKPALLVFDTCRHFIRTVPVLPRDEKKPDDIDTDAEDHVWDETRYRILDNAQKPNWRGGRAA